MIRLVFQYPLISIHTEFPLLGHRTIDELLQTAYAKNYAVLLDSFVAGHYQEKITKFRLVEVMEYVFSNGLVLENKGLWLEQNIRTYIQNNKDTLFRIMSSSIRSLKVKSFFAISFLMANCI